MSRTTTPRTRPSTHNFLEDLSADELAYLTRIVVATECTRGRAFYHPAEPAYLVFILKHGQVAISRLSSRGKKLVVATLEPGAVFGETTIAGHQTHDTLAEAVTNCLVWILTQAAFEDLIQSHPRLALHLLRALAERVAHSQARFEDIAYKGIPTRLAAVLLRLSTETDFRGSQIVTGLSHEDLAALVGTYRETVTATLAQFRAIGLVHVERRRITLLDPEGLAVIAAS